MIRFTNERHNVIGNATARLWMFKNVVTSEGHPFVPALLRTAAVTQREPGARLELDAVPCA